VCKNLKHVSCFRADNGCIQQKNYSIVVLSLDVNLLNMLLFFASSTIAFLLHYIFVQYFFSFSFFVLLVTKLSFFLKFFFYILFLIVIIILKYFFIKSIDDHLVGSSLKIVRRNITASMHIMSAAQPCSQYM